MQKMLLVVAALLFLGAGFIYLAPKAHAPGIGGMVATTTASHTASTTRFTLKELGIQIHPSTELSGLRYRTATVQALGTVLFMTTSHENPPCELGAFYRIEKKDLANPKTRWDADALRIATQQNGDVPPQAKEFPDFYFVFESSQAACSNEQTKILQESKDRQALWQSVQTAEAL